jgi:maltose O-acetyltransferase
VTTAAGEPPRAARSLASRVRDLLSVQFGLLRPRVLLVGLLEAPLPRGLFGELRASLLRLLGSEVGPGTLLLGMPTLTGGERPLGPNLAIGAGCEIAEECSLELGEKLTLGAGVRLGPGVLILTTTHELGPKEHRAGPLVSKPVIIESGASVGARAIVLPGVTIGEGSQLLAGSVLNKDMPPRTRWGGIPAKQLGPVEPQG